jgi:hypothetical protein
MASRKRVSKYNYYMGIRFPYPEGENARDRNIRLKVRSELLTTRTYDTHLIYVNGVCMNKRDETKIKGYASFPLPKFLLKDMITRANVKIVTESEPGFGGWQIGEKRHGKTLLDSNFPIMSSFRHSDRTIGVRIYGDNVAEVQAEMNRVRAVLVSFGYRSEELEQCAWQKNIKLIIEEAESFSTKRKPVAKKPVNKGYRTKYFRDLDRSSSL